MHQEVLRSSRAHNSCDIRQPPFSPQIDRVQDSDARNDSNHGSSASKHQLGVHHSIALLYLRTLPSVPILVHGTTTSNSCKACRRKRVMVAKALLNSRREPVAGSAGGSIVASKPVEGAAAAITLPDPRATFLHSQSQYFPEISSDETLSDSSASSHGETRRGVDSDVLRALFASSMSSLYKSEVPLYGDLLSIVADVNGDVMARHPGLVSDEELSRLNVERHGAMRVGKPEELRLLARIFRVLGMSAVGYYDLWRDAGLPIHSTAFRPVGEKQLMKNPFRVFCSLLRIDLIRDSETRKLAEELLEKRQIASPRCLELLEKLEASMHFGGSVEDGRTGSSHEPLQFGVSRDEAIEFIEECIQIFKWHSDTTVSKRDYDKLKAAHPLVADIVSFRGPHINHLTPRTLDIDEVQREMGRRGIDAKEIVEGPPARTNPIYLRQTSFHALNEQVSFADPLNSSARVLGHHTARFGEIEQRGQALTGKGADLYDEVMGVVQSEKASLERRQGRKASSDEFMEILGREFTRRFTDDADDIRRHGLGFYQYHITGELRGAAEGHRGGGLLDALIHNGSVVAKPIVFEDFLPASAAGIFQSNLGASAKVERQSESARAAQQREAEEARKRLEEAVDAPLLDPFELYSRQEVSSLEQVAKAVGVEAVVDLF
ncbi:hypothetical protein ACQY0O_000933 [Thecaphora frezii]